MRMCDATRHDSDAGGRASVNTSSEIVLATRRAQRVGCARGGADALPVFINHGVET